MFVRVFLFSASNTALTKQYSKLLHFAKLLAIYYNNNTLYSRVFCFVKRLRISLFLNFSSLKVCLKSRFNGLYDINNLRARIPWIKSRRKRSVLSLDEVKVWKQTWSTVWNIRPVTLSVFFSIFNNWSIDFYSSTIYLVQLSSLFLICPNCERFS